MYTHAPYYINLANPCEEMIEVYLETVIDKVTTTTKIEIINPITLDILILLDVMDATKRINNAIARNANV